MYTICYKMVMYNQYINPEIDSKLKKIAELVREEKKHKGFTKIDSVIMILEENVDKYLENESNP